MKTSYTKRLGPGAIASVLLSRARGLAWNIDRVTVPPEWRGRGISRQLLRLVLADADRLGIALRLEARACGGLSQRDLVNYYRRLGFAPTGRRGVFGPIMVRQPLAAVAR